MYGFCRFFLEFFRDEPQVELITWLNSPQLICLVTIMIGVLFLTHIGRSTNRPLLLNSCSGGLDLIKRNTDQQWEAT